MATIKSVFRHNRASASTGKKAEMTARRMSKGLSHMGRRHCTSRTAMTRARKMRVGSGKREAMTDARSRCGSILSRKTRRGGRSLEEVGRRAIKRLRKRAIGLDFEKEEARRKRGWEGGRRRGGKRDGASVRWDVEGSGAVQADSTARMFLARTSAAGTSNGRL